MRSAIAMATTAAMAAMVTMLAAPRRAEACSPPPPEIRPVRPITAELAIPTNTLIWMSGVPVDQVMVRGNNEVIETDVQLVERLGLYVAKPKRPLLPGVTYTVTATSPQLTLPTSWHFTTGSAPETLAPPAPTKIKVVATVNEDIPGSCGLYAKLAVEVTSEPVSGAAIYQLEVMETNGYVATEYALSPRFRVGTESVPTPLYRIRPIGFDGAPPTEELPEGRAERQGDSDEDDGGGCAATPNRGGAGSALALLFVGALLARRQRARGISTQ